MEQKKKGIGIKAALLLFGLVPFVSIVIILTVVNVYNLSTQLKERESQKLSIASESVNQYFAYDIVANGDVDYDEYADHDFIESLKDENIELTLIKGDTRLLTSLKNDQGKYNEGTQIDSGIVAELKAGKSYSDDNVIIGGEAYYVYYEPIYDGDGAYWGAAFAGTPRANVKKSINSVILSIFIITIICAVVFTALIITLARKIYGTMTIAANSLDILATGKLTEDVKGKSVISEINSIIESAGLLQHQLKDSVGNAIVTSGNLGEAVEKVDESSVRSSEATEQISRAASELATTAQTVAMTVQDANVSVMEMGEAIAVITDKADASAMAAESMKNFSNDAVSIMGRVNESNKKSVKAIDEIGGLTQACSESVEKIKKAADVISEIAQQTNLLALNASIEAARAGEAGRGFAVVAESIKNLAGQSGESATEISGFVEDIVDKVDQCVVASKDAEVIMEDQKKLVEEATESIESLSVTVDEVALNVGDSSNSASALNMSKDSVLNNISDLSAISEENAASSEEVSASVESIASAITQTKDESRVMKELAVELGDKMSFFSI